MAEYGDIRIPVTVEAEDALSSLEALAEALEGMGAKAQSTGEAGSQAAQSAASASEQARQSADAYAALGEAAAQGFRQLASGAEQGAQGSSRMQGALEKLRRSVTSLAAQKQAVNTLENMAKAAQKNGTAFGQLDPKLQSYIRDQGLMGAGMDQVVAALGREDKALSQTSASMLQSLQAQRNQWMDTKAAIESGAHGVMTADGSQLMAQANSAISILSALIAMLSAAGSANGSGGGGGGGGRSSKAAAAAAAARQAAEDLKNRQREALEEQIRLLEQKKRVGEINTREEIRELERIQRQYAVNAELRLEMENKIFEVRARLRDEEIAQLDKLNEGIITALRNRYEEQRDLEQKHLDDSMRAWQDWSDQTVSAIQAQLEALDAAEKQESRDDKEQKALRKIAERKMALAYETDAYSRRQLEQEIARLEEEWAKQQADWARDDERERLQAQIDAVQQRAQAEQDALQEQKDALDEVYDQLTENTSLRAEAEQMLVKSNQQEIVDLIGSYAPEYEATGRTLGERLYSGMVESMGNISGWFDAFSERITAIQSQAAQTANQMSNQFYSGQLTGGIMSTGQPSAVTVEQNTYFNVPVESPSDVTGRMERINEELAAQLAG